MSKKYPSQLDKYTDVMQLMALPALQAVEDFKFP